MSFCTRRFNLYFLAVALGLALSGCAHSSSKEKNVGVLRVHIESENAAAGGKTVPVLRSQPVAINIVNDPILTEGNLVSARLMEAPGGCAIEVKFDNAGAWTLEQFSSANPGKHLVIFGQWSNKLPDGRWLAAPLIVHRMAGGTLLFTPDATHEEMDKWVKGMNDYIKKNKSKDKE